MPVKYLGSKRRLVPTLVELSSVVGASTAIDLFTGSTRVAAAWRTAGLTVTAVDRLSFVHAVASTYVATTLGESRRQQLDDALRVLDALDGVDGYVTQTFCRESRYFTPDSGARIDAIRRAIAERYRETWLEPVLLTALIEAADRVDSTTGLQMAYLKRWAPRAAGRLTLRVPDIPGGPVGRALCADAVTVAGELEPADLAYLDPPYNQHRYEGNYHVWETICLGDAPTAYGVARKRVDVRDDPAWRSAFNDRRALPGALAHCVAQVPAAVVVVSCSNEGWLGVDEVVALCERRGRPLVLAFDSARYVGARIGIHAPNGERVGTVSHVRNTEYLVVAGDLSRRQRVALAGLARPPVVCA